MEQGIIVFFLVAVVVTKGLTLVWLAQRRKELWALEAEDAEVSKKLESVEATKLQLEREKKALDRELNLLENDKNLVCIEIQKLGAEPVAESELDAIAASAAGTVASEASADAHSARTEDAGAGSPGQPPAGKGRENGPEAPPRARVLVVDDNEELRDILQQILMRDYEVSQASDGLDALTKIVKEKQAFDLVVTDLRMPNINGVTLVDNLPKGIPVIVISAYVQREEFQDALRRINPVAVLQKPFKLADVREAVERALGIRTALEPAPSAPPEEADAGPLG